MKRSVGLQDDTPLFMVQSGYIEQRGLVTGPTPILPDDLHRAKVLKIAKQRYPKWCTWDNPMTWLVVLLLNSRKVAGVLSQDHQPGNLAGFPRKQQVKIEKRS